MIEPKPGRPYVHIQEYQIDVIVEAFGKVFTLARAAGLAHVSPYQLKRWMTTGQKDFDSGKFTLEAQLFDKVAWRLSDKAAHYIDMLGRCPDNSGCLTWLLEKGFKADYGNDSEESKELKEMFESLAAKVQRITEIQPGRGINGEELDPESN
jgi:hypothetical protein